MDLKQLEVFYCVYEERSFSKAARRLHLSQPTISAHIKALEEYFATPLLDRLGRQSLPTRAGEYLYRHSRQILRMKRNLVEEMSRFLEGLEGELIMGASTIPGEYLLPPLLVELRESHPGIRARLAISDTRAVTHEVNDGGLELGFVGARTDADDVEFQRFSSDRLVVTVPPSRRWEDVDSISLRQLMGEPLIIREAGSGTRTMVERQLHKLGCRMEDFNIVAELGSTTAIKQAIKVAAGWSILSRISVEDELSVGLLKTVSLQDVPTLERDFYIVTNTRRTRSPICETFLALVQERSRAVAGS